MQDERERTDAGSVAGFDHAGNDAGGNRDQHVAIIGLAPFLSPRWFAQAVVATVAFRFTAMATAALAMWTMPERMPMLGSALARLQ